MSKRPVAAALVTVAALVLLINFRTPDVTANAAVTAGQAVLAAPAAATPATGTTGSGAPTTSGAATASSAATSATSSSGGTSSGTTASSGTFTGTAIDTRYGPVQVQVTIAGGTITAVEAVEYPSSDPHSSRINQSAIPALVQEALQAQSAQVNTISGATYTSEAFIQSLQSALAAARA